MSKVTDLKVGGAARNKIEFTNGYWRGVKACMSGDPEPESVGPGFREGYAAQYTIEQYQTHHSMQQSERQK